MELREGQVLIVVVDGIRRFGGEVRHVTTSDGQCIVTVDPVRVGTSTERGNKRRHANEKARNSKSRDTAHRHRQEWTGPELEIAARKDLTRKQVAEMTGRTLDAVKRARAKLADHPREQNLAGI